MKKIEIYNRDKEKKRIERKPLIDFIEYCEEIDLSEDEPEFWEKTKYAYLFNEECIR